jgi:aryl-alcohol dehydrogenase-like predicted oxidoreductase
VGQGKVRYIGCSNLPAAAVRWALDASETAQVDEICAST